MSFKHHRKIWILALLICVGCRASGELPTSVSWSGNRLGSNTSGKTGMGEVGPAGLMQPNTQLADQEVDSISNKPQKSPVTLAAFQQPASDTVTRIDNESTEIYLSLAEAIGLGQLRNPNLQATRSSEPVAAAMLKVAETYPYNPQFQTQILPYARDVNGNRGQTSQQHVILQTYEWGGQQGYREGVAEANVRQVDRTVRQAELMNAAQTALLYYTALYQHELRELNRKSADLNAELVGVTQRRQNAGQANRADVELTRLQDRASRRQKRLADANYQTALRGLKTQLNINQNSGLYLSNDWTQWNWLPLNDLFSEESMQVSLVTDSLATENSSGEDLPLNDNAIRQLIFNRPDVAAARAGVELASQNWRLANGMKRPNLQAGPLYQTDETSAQFWGFQAQINIPVVNTGQPLVNQRCAELRQQQITAAQLENRAVLEARAALQRYARARQLLELSRVDFERDLTESLKPFDDQFKAGQITLLQVYAARSTLVQSQQSFFALLNELALATADVTLATGLLPQQLFQDASHLP